MDMEEILPEIFDLKEEHQRLSNDHRVALVVLKIVMVMLHLLFLHISLKAISHLNTLEH